MTPPDVPPDISPDIPIDAATRLFGVFGDPVGHSLSPAMHNAAFRAVGGGGVYLAFRIVDIAEGVRAVRTLNLRGVSVTIPHKVSVVPHLDALTPLARKIGAVNTITNDDGVLEGDNTDARGATSALARHVALAGKTVAILGAGGAARAVAFGVMAAGARVAILNRTARKGESLAADLNATFLSLTDLRPERYEILINTTPVGMTPRTDAMPVPETVLAPGMTVMDIIYSPLRTRLLEAAQRRGCTVVDGLGMFVGQGAAQFERWTGKPAPLSVMTRRVTEALTTS